MIFLNHRNRERQILNCWVSSFVTLFSDGVEELSFNVMEGNLMSVSAPTVGNSRPWEA